MNNPAAILDLRVTFAMSRDYLGSLFSVSQFYKVPSLELHRAFKARGAGQPPAAGGKGGEAMTSGSSSQGPNATTLAAERAE